MTLKEQILKLRNDGKSYNKIMTKLGCSKGTISYHIGFNVRQKQNQRQSIKRKDFGDELKLSHSGKCLVCGYDKCLEALDFHHIDPAQKDFAVLTHHKRRNKQTIIRESNKCMLLCSNCHRELHAGLFMVVPGRLERPHSLSKSDMLPLHHGTNVDPMGVEPMS